MAEHIHLVANNPDLGGGERMLLRHAEALTELGHHVQVVTAGGELAEVAAAAGIDVLPIRATDRPRYIRALRNWDRRERDGLLWCHGLVPALATAGHRRRIVHLHQQPQSRGQAAALVVARRPALRVLVPSQAMTHDVMGARVHLNWTEDLPLLPRPPRRPRLRVGFLGRLTTDKGLDVLARAVGTLVGAGHDVELVVGGDDRHVPADRRDAVLRALDETPAEVSLLGQVERAEVLARVDVAVFPSISAEPFGLVAAEAMASGVPFVVSDAGALPEVAGPDHPWIARTGDADDLARVIALALSASDDDVRAVTERARARWEADYSPHAGRLRVRRLLEELAP
ncbi:glycosyltransferase involved in cell wall biosynthesis [Nocardioides sp. BE266]|uniref:glycosyltransferase family 4 protein n=1 Tax=Nocardioides sp. BE266 TaxID=2817725 RepID=UPI00285E2D4D|nr:glycosyltransferase family 4 protein [Nocardioides sp. BE266]MDR7252124.1 glycosyltransferase involved in cell wall biosynthesis [Nocardioides sp. BE266]